MLCDRRLCSEDVPLTDVAGVRPYAHLHVLLFAAAPHLPPDPILFVEDEAAEDEETQANHDKWPEEGWDDDEDDWEKRFDPAAISVLLRQLSVWLLSIVCEKQRQDRGDDDENAVDDRE